MTTFWQTPHGMGIGGGYKLLQIVRTRMYIKKKIIILQYSSNSMHPYY